MKSVLYVRLDSIRRPDTGVSEWIAAMVRGLDALEFLERSRELAAEAVLATPARAIAVTSRRENFSGSGSGPAM